MNNDRECETSYQSPPISKSQTISVITSTTDDLHSNHSILSLPTYDEDKIFGDFVAGELRSINSKIRKNQLRRKIQRYVLKMADEEYTNGAKWRSFNSDTIAIDSDSSVEFCEQDDVIIKIDDI